MFTQYLILARKRLVFEVSPSLYQEANARSSNQMEKTLVLILEAWCIPWKPSSQAS